MHVCFYVDLGMIARVLRRSRFIHVVFSAGCLIARAAYGHRCLYVKLGMSVCVLRRSLEKLWKRRTNLRTNLSWRISRILKS